MATQTINSKKAVAVKSDKAAKVAKVDVQAVTETAKETKVEARITYTKNTRQVAEEQGIGLNTFGSWVGRANILDSLVNRLARNYHTICDAIAEREGKLCAHVTQGCKGAHVGLCLEFADVTFTDVADGDCKHTVYVKDNGVMYVDGLCEGFTILSESELRMQAIKVNDIRRVRLDVRKGSEWVGETVDAALLGTLNGRYQGLMFRDASGVRVITRIFGEAKEHENARAISIVTLANEAKQAAARWIFDGIAETKEKLSKKAKAAVKAKAGK